jgi:hypothetical protein
MLTRVYCIQPLLKQNSTAIPYREVQGFAGKSLLPKQDLCNENRVPVPCNGNRLFPVIIDLQEFPVSLTGFGFVVRLLIFLCNKQ